MKRTACGLHSLSDERGSQVSPFSWHWQMLSVVCLILLLWSQHQQMAQADGGAPNLAYVAGTETGVSVIDVAARHISKTLVGTAAPGNILLSQDGSLLYLTQPQQGRVSAIDTATGKQHCSAALAGSPSLLALSPQADALYAAGNNAAHVYVLNPTTCKQQQVFTAPGPVYGLATSFLGGAFPTHTGLYQLWIATTDQLTVFDTDGKRLASFPLPAGPQTLCIPPGVVIYSTTRAGTVVALDLATSQVSAPLLAGATFGSLDYDAITGQIYVPDLTHQNIAVLTPLTSGSHQTPKEPVRTLPMPAPPTAIAITSDGQLGFATLQDGRVVMLDIPGRQTVTTLTVGGHPHFIITGLYPPSSTTASTQPPSTTSFPSWQMLLLILFAVIFFVALIAILIILRLMWRQRSQ